MLTLLLMLQDVNREYEAWKSHRPGTRVTFVSTARIDGAAVGGPMEKTSTLVRVTAKDVLLEETNSIGAPPGKSIVTAAPSERERGERETGRGKETLRVGEKEFACEWVERTLDKGAAKVVTKTWYAAELPGAVVKRVHRLEGGGASREFTDQVKDWESK